MVVSSRWLKVGSGNDACLIRSGALVKVAKVQPVGQVAVFAQLAIKLVAEVSDQRGGSELAERRRGAGRWGKAVHDGLLRIGPLPQDAVRMEAMLARARDRLCHVELAKTREKKNRHFVLPIFDRHVIS